MILPRVVVSVIWVGVIAYAVFAGADFGSGLYNGSPIGIPYMIVNNSHAGLTINFTAYGHDSKPGPYPIPADALIEGGSQSAGDRHVLVLDRGNCMLYELFSAYPQAGGSWQAGSGAVYALDSNDLRPSGWTSADAAGLPILPKAWYATRNFLASPAPVPAS